MSGPAAPTDAQIAVCLATFEPDQRLLRMQIDSLRAQTDQHWSCVISDDGSSPAAVAGIEAAIGDDQRFKLHRHRERLSFYGNFERALRLAPPEAALVALCDQDDSWHPDKLATLRAHLGEATLVYSDQRLVAQDGTLLRDTLWRGRHNDHSDLVSMLVANTVTGAACLLRRDVVELALPFPCVGGLQFHDHWIALIALAAGDIAYVDRPLYDYVQHPGAVFGDVSTGARRRRTLRPPSAHAAYVYGYRTRVDLARELIRRCGDRLTAGKRAGLERFIAAERSPAALAWLVGRGLRGLALRGSTLGSELGMAQGILWRWASRTPLISERGAPHPGDFEQRRLRRWRARLN